MPYKGQVNDGNAEHQEPRKDTYAIDQERQRLARERERLQQHKDLKQEFYGKAVVEIDGESFRHEDAQWEPDELKFAIDRTGKELTPEEHLALLVERKKRIRYLRPDGSWERLRERPTILVQNPETKKWKKVRIETPVEKISGVRYEAFLIRPDLSAALVLACRGGFGTLAKKLAQEVDRACLREFERFTGFAAVAGPLHPKLFAGHFQVSSNRIAESGRLLAEADLPHLGRKILGAWTLSTVFEITGKKLDELTGHEDAQVGIDDALDDRGDRAVDFHMYKFIAERFEAKLRKDRFKALVPFADMGRKLVLQFQEKLLDFLRDPDEKIEEAASRARDDGRQEGLDERTGLQNKLTTAEVENDKLRAEASRASESLLTAQDQAISAEKHGYEKGRKDAEVDATLKQAALSKKIGEKDNESAELKAKLNQSVETIVIAREQTTSAEQTTDVYFKETLAVVADGLKAINALMKRAAQGEKIGEEFSGFVAVTVQTGVALVTPAWLKRAEEFRELAGACDVLLLQAAAAEKHASLKVKLNEIVLQKPEPKIENKPIELFGSDLRLNPVIAKHLPAVAAELASLGLLKGPLRSPKQGDETPKVLPAPETSMLPGSLPTPIPVVTVPRADVRLNPSVTAKPEPTPIPVAVVDETTLRFQVLHGALDALELRHNGDTLSTDQEAFLRIDECVAGGRVLSESTEAVLSRCRSNLLFEALAEKVDQRLEIAEAGRRLFDIYNELKAVRCRVDGDHLPGFKFLNPDGSIPSYIREAIDITLHEESYYGKARLPEAAKYRVELARIILNEVNKQGPVLDIEHRDSPSRSQPEPERS
jgi:hypothetical protein